MNQRTNNTIRYLQMTSKDDQSLHAFDISFTYNYKKIRHFRMTRLIALT